MKSLKDLKHIMFENYTEEELLEVYKLKLISLENNKSNEDMIKYYKNEILKLNESINNKKELQGKIK